MLLRINLAALDILHAAVCACPCQFKKLTLGHESVSTDLQEVSRIVGEISRQAQTLSEDGTSEGTSESAEAIEGPSGEIGRH